MFSARAQSLPVFDGDGKRKLRAVAARIVTGVLIGTLCSQISPHMLAGQLPGSINLAHALSGSNDPACAGSYFTDSRYTGYARASMSNLMDFQSNVSFNLNKIIVCSTRNYYTPGIAKNATINGTCDGYAQTGWYADSRATTHLFSYTQGYNQPVSTCGIILDNLSSPNGNYGYEISLGAGYTGICGSSYVGDIQYWLLDTSGNPVGITDEECTNWKHGDELDVFSERADSGSHIGAIGYWWTKYCSSTSDWGCTPNTAVGNVSSYIPTPVDTQGYVHTLDSWQNFNACDNRDFTTATC